jgi:hypothetical protein
MKAREALKEAVRKEVRKFLREADIFADEPQDDRGGQAAQPTPDQNQQAASNQGGDTSNQVSLGKVSGSPSSGTGEPEEISLENTIEKLNSIRSGKSFKDDHVMAQMEKYYGDLKDAERKALQAFLTGISQIVTAGVPGEQAPEPEEAPTNVHMVDKSQIKSKSVKPNVIHKGGGGGGGQKPVEDTSAPVSVKQR